MNIKKFVGSVVFSAAIVGCLGAADAPAILEVDGVKISAAEIEKAQKMGLFQARNNYFQAEKKAVEEYVDTYLVEREAKKLNMTVDEMLEKTVYTNLPGDPGEEALKFYFEGLNTTETYEKARPLILEHVRKMRKDKAKAEWMKKLKASAKVSMNLSVPRADISLAGAPQRWNKDAKVNIVEYADFECPYCQSTYTVIERIGKEYSDKVNFVYKDTPLPMHANAQKAAEAAHCAEDQGKFWEYHDTIFKTKALMPEDLKSHAKTLKLDTEKFDSCLDTDSKASVVKGQLDEAMALKIEGTPSFFINGRFYAGNMSYEELRQVIEEELRNAK